MPDFEIYYLFRNGLLIMNDSERIFKHIETYCKTLSKLCQLPGLGLAWWIARASWEEEVETERGLVFEISLIF